MIYVTGDCHGEYRKFAKHQRIKLPYDLGKEDYVIVCGDMGLLWNKKDKTFDYNAEWLSRLPFTILFVDGNHEGFTLLNEYPIELWNGGKVHHIVKDKVIHLMRGQVFEIQGKKIFTFGGASSHDIQGGILDKNDPLYDSLRRKAIRRELPYRVLNESWWAEELPNDKEMQEGRENLEKVEWNVDYIISHCISTSIQKEIATRRRSIYEKDILTEYFEELKQKLTYKQWFCGHYHIDSNIDKKHTVLYQEMMPIEGDFCGGFYG